MQKTFLSDTWKKIDRFEGSCFFLIVCLPSEFEWRSDYVKWLYRLIREKKKKREREKR